MKFCAVHVFQENIELTKDVQDLKIQIENVSYLKSQVAGQLEDARRRLEDDERVSYFLFIHVAYV